MLLAPQQRCRRFRGVENWYSWRDGPETPVPGIFDFPPSFARELRRDMPRRPLAVEVSAAADDPTPIAKKQRLTHYGFAEKHPISKQMCSRISFYLITGYSVLIFRYSTVFFRIMFP